MVDIPRDWDGFPVQLDEPAEQVRHSPGVIKRLLGRLAARSASQKDGAYFSGYYFDKKGRPIPFYPDRPEPSDPPESQTASHLGQ